MDTMNLPDGWVSETFSDCIKLKSGDGLTAKKMITGSYPVFGGNGIAGYHNDFNLSGENIIIGRVGALCGNARYINNEIWLTDNAFKMTQSKFDFDLKFLNYLLNYVDLRSYARQTAQPVISNASLKNINLSFPKSITQQKQIVAILDKAFTAIDTAKANAEQNLQNAKQLFESYLQNVFENKGDDWEEKKIEELSNEKKAIVSGPFGSNLKVSDYREEGIPMIRLQNVGKGYFIDKSIKYVDASKAEELKSHSFETGDIVLAKLGIPIGKTCIIPEYFGSGIIVADIVRIRPDKKIVDYKFVEYFLNTDLSVSQLNKNISGATRPRVNLSDVRNILMPLPSLNKQKQIVKKIDALSAETRKLEAQYTQKIADLDELKKSILQQAFSGKLTLSE